MENFLTTKITGLDDMSLLQLKSSHFVDVDGVIFVRRDHAVNILKSAQQCTPHYTMDRDQFKSFDDGNGGKIVLGECPNCKDGVVWGQGCVACDSDIKFTENI